VSSQGWFRLHRKAFSESDQFWNENRPRTKWEARLDLIRQAAHTAHEVEWEGATLKIDRGELPTSERRLAEAWGWSRKKVRYFLSQLSAGSEPFLVTKRARVGAHGLTVLRICKYDTYQSPDSAQGPTVGPAEGPRKAHERPTKEPNRSKGKNGKEGKKAPQGALALRMNDGGEGGNSVRPHQLVAVWIDQQPSRPSETDIRKQGAAARRLCSSRSAEQIAAAVVGIGQLMPHSKGEPWDLFDLERKFSKAQAAAVNHPQIKSKARARQLREALGA